MPVPFKRAGFDLLLDPKLANKKIIQVVALCLVVLALMVSLFFDLHLTDDAAGGKMLWNSQEAYLFVALSRDGYHLTPFHYLLASVPAYLGVPRTRDDTRSFTIVFRITPTGVEEHVAPDIGFRAYIPRGETIYAWDGGPLWKWAGTQFERASPEEQQTIILDENILFSKKDYVNVDGWSMRHSLRGWPSKSEIELAGKPVIFLSKANDRPTTKEEIALEVQLPGGTPQTILHAMSWPHLVSKPEYDRTFKKP